ncbi:MAG: response regulator transcription factor [Bacteroidales bacterium]|nr:response regulator transcription factor [Bacteroidales bacterium]
MAISVFIVDDHFMVIEGIKTLLAGEKDIILTGHAMDGKSALEYLKKNHTDVILMDINLPDINGMDLCAMVHNEYPKVKIIGLSTFNQLAYVESMIQNGASGYLLKNSTREEITEAIELVMDDKKIFSPEVKEMMKETSDTTPLISRREREVLQCISEGLTSKEISEKLFISINTVNTHRKSLMMKLNVNKTADLVRWAVKFNLVTITF